MADATVATIQQLVSAAPGWEVLVHTGDPAGTATQTAVLGVACWALMSNGTVCPMVADGNTLRLATVFDCFEIRGPLRFRNSKA